jgi:hypothetical protein
MPAAGAQAFLVATGAGAAALWSDALVAEGAGLAGCRVAVGFCSASGVPSARVAAGETCDWVRRQLR